MMAGPSRFAALALLLLLAGCGGETVAPQSFAPLTYGYLTPLRLDVASLAVDDQAVPQGEADVAARSPVPPAQALEQMARDRVFPSGSAGEARFVIEQASILRHGDRLDGRLSVHLTLSNGGHTGSAEAQVSRSSVGDAGDLPTRLYGLTRQMMDDMNVEFEYQVRRSLRSWLQPEGDRPVPVQVQPLDGSPRPAAAPRAPAAGGPSFGAPSAGASSFGAPPGGAPPSGASSLGAPPAGVPPYGAPLGMGGVVPAPAVAPAPLQDGGSPVAPALPAPVTLSPPPGFLVAPPGSMPAPLPAPTPLAPPTPLGAAP